MTDCLTTLEKPKCRAAQVLGKMARGKPKKYSPEELQKRTARLLAAKQASLLRATQAKLLKAQSS